MSKYFLAALFLFWPYFFFSPEKWQLQRNWVESNELMSNDHVFSAEISEFQKVDVKLLH